MQRPPGSERGLFFFRRRSAALLLSTLAVACGGADVAQTEGSPSLEAVLSIERLEWEHIQQVLSEHGGNISATARSLNMHRRTLQRKLAKRPVRG